MRQTKNKANTANTGFTSDMESPPTRSKLCKLGALCHALRDSVLVESFVLQNHTMHQVTKH